MPNSVRVYVSNFGEAPIPAGTPLCDAVLRKDGDIDRRYSVRNRRSIEQAEQLESELRRAWDDARV